MGRYRKRIVKVKEGFSWQPGILASWLIESEGIPQPNCGNEAFLLCGGRCGKHYVGYGQVRVLQPDLVLLDINMPVMDGLRATLEIRRIAPTTKVVLFSINDSPEAKLAARMVGADALVRKVSAVFDLLPTMRRLVATELTN